MDKINILETRLKNLLEENYKDKEVEQDVKEGLPCRAYRKSAFEFVLDMILQIKEEKNDDRKKTEV